MIDVRRSADRGYADHGWLKTYHSFSFADYFDEQHMRFGPLRVLNEDFILGGAGFDTHPHRDMEIVTYVLAGSLAHRDNTGGSGEIRAGEVQRMSAGRGILHSERNASATEPVHLLQVWFLPDRVGLSPEYEQKALDRLPSNTVVPIVSGRNDESPMRIHQDMTFSAGHLTRGGEAEIVVPKGRYGYLHNAMIGRIETSGLDLGPGDGLKMIGPEKLRLKGREESRFVFFDLPPQ